MGIGGGGWRVGVVEDGGMMEDLVVDIVELQKSMKRQEQLLEQLIKLIRQIIVIKHGSP